MVAGLTSPLLFFVFDVFLWYIAEGGIMKCLELIKVSKILKINGEEKIIFNNFSFDFEDGKIYVLKFKQNLLRKSLFKCLGLFDFFSDGRVRVCKENINRKKSRYIRQKYMSFILRENYLVDTLTLKENILLPVLYANSVDTENTLSLRDVLMMVGFNSYQDRLVKNMNKTDLRKALVARAMIVNPKIVFVDGVLNCDRLMQNMLKKIAGLDKCIIIFTQNDSYDKYSDYIICFDNQKVIVNNTVNKTSLVNGEYYGL